MNAQTGAVVLEHGSPAWRRAASQAKWLSWASLAYMTAEGAIAIVAAVLAGSVALLGLGFDSVIEGAGSVIIVWRFSGARTLSETAERRAQRGVALSFWLLAPYIAAESARDLATGHHPETTVIGMVLTAVALLEMPLLGWAKHRLAARLGSAAVAGEGTQNYLCAAQAAAVLAALAVTAAWHGGWWTDPLIGLGIAAVAVREGIGSWRGDDCC